jgi:hypothetical protein
MGMRLGDVVQFQVVGVPWPLGVTHQTTAALVAAEVQALRQPAAALRALDLHAPLNNATPAPSQAHLWEWLDYRMALAPTILAAAVEALSPTTRQLLMLRILACHEPGDGVWELMGTGIGVKPMSQPFATRWDCHGVCVYYTDDFVESTPIGLGAKVHPLEFLRLEPVLLIPWTYHTVARPKYQLTWAEYNDMSAAEAQCARTLRDAAERNKRK